MHDATKDTSRPESGHTPVMCREVMDALQVEAGKWYVDATFGRGGYTNAIIDRGGKVVAFDHDGDAIAFGQAHFAAELKEGNLVLVHKNFSKLEETIRQYQADLHIQEVHGVCFDFGVSSPQLADMTRGFSFAHDAELDMRMDQRLGVQAKDLLAILPERQLAELFSTYGGEAEAKVIARAIAQQRARKPITRTTELAKLIERVKRSPRRHLHPATKVFQALRMAVNSELDSIVEALPQAQRCLTAGGRIVTVCFHEGEDRLAKNAFRSWEQDGLGTHETKEVITPSDEEVARNPRSRSAKLRIFLKKRS